MFIPRQKVEHQRVYRLKNYGGFYVQLKTKAGSKQISVMGDLAQLIDALSSPFASFFIDLRN